MLLVLHSVTVTLLVVCKEVIMVEDSPHIKYAEHLKQHFKLNTCSPSHLICNH